MKKKDAKIVILEDEIASQKILALLLNNAGYANIKVFGSHGPGLEFLRANKADLIISDVRMLGIDGAVGARKIRQLTEAPIIFYSNMPEEYLEKQMTQIRGTTYIAKAQGPDKLLNEIALRLN